MKRLTGNAIPLIAVVFALASCESGGAEVTRNFRLEHLGANDAISVVEPYLTENVSVQVNTEDRRTLRIAGPAEQLDEIGDVLARHDVARQVRLRFQLVEADGFTDTDPAIADVEAALRELFRFEGYRQVAEALVVASQGTESSQKLLGFGNVPLELTTFIDRISLPGEGATASIAVTLDGPTGRILRTLVAVPDGQTVVLGTARPFEDRGALILVVRPEIQ